ncbi:hypothetical protein LCGC14_2911500 [marine sediment metagenome]|uniref:Uncharacterized protein n=1 Tax=marine sediment metagenome TaxID=412755 RepID=A0A0F8YD91_9ZZZZ
MVAPGASKLETLQEKLAKLQGEVKAEEVKVQQETAIAEIRDAFSVAITDAIAAVEKATEKSLAEIGLGVWVAYSGDVLTVSALVVGDDGLPKALKRPSVASTNNNGDGHVSGDKEFVLADGRTFDTCLDAVHAMGIKTHDAAGNKLDGKKYHHRHDRLPKEIKDAITVRAKATEPADAATQAETVGATA